MLELKLLGFPKLRFGGEALAMPSSKALALLCYLACQHEPVHRKALAELLWNTTSTASVRVALSELRSLVGADDWLEADGQLLRLSATTDVGDFESALLAGNYETALNYWESAADPVFLNNLEVKKAPDFSDWLAAERSRLNELHSEALQGQVAELKAQKRFEEALPLAHSILAKDALNEDVHRTIMALEHARGNSEGALRQFAVLQQTLKEELGVEPLAETLELLKEIQQASISTGKTARVLNKAEDVPALPDTLRGRGDLLIEIDQTLSANKRVLLHGFGGTGKTALAASFVKGWLERSRGTVLWLQAGDDTPETLFDAVARAFNAQLSLTQSNDPDTTLAELLSKNLSLFVLDDAWNGYALNRLLDVLPAGLPFIVTARQRYPKLRRLDVGKLKREDALGLLSFYASAEDPTTDIAADALCNLLGDHPLAVRIAGLTLQASDTVPAALLSQIRDQPHSMKAPAAFAEEGRESVASLLASSARTLSDAAYEALLGCGSLYTSSTTPELLALALRRDQDATEDALIELQKRGLTDRQTEAGSDVITYRLHDLVFSFAKTNTNLRPSTLMTAGQTFLDNHKRDFDVLDAEINNILGGAQVAQFEAPELFIKMMSQLSVGDAYYLARGHSPRSLKLLISASELAEALGDCEAAHYLYARLGDTYRVLYANYEKAFEVYEKSLGFARQMHNVQREATLLSVIGITRFHQNEQDADEYLRTAQELAESSKDNLVLSNVLQHRGYVAGHADNWQLTRTLCQRAIAVAYILKDDPNSNLSDIHHRLFFSLLNLGEAERKLGNFSKGVEAREKALETAVEEGNDLWEAHAYLELGEMYHDVDQKELAKQHYTKALTIYRENNAYAYVEKINTWFHDNNYLVGGV